MSGSIISKPFSLQGLFALQGGFSFLQVLKNRLLESLRAVDELMQETSR